MALDDMPTVPATLKILALTLETTPELFIWRLITGKLGALESVSSLFD